MVAGVTVADAGSLGTVIGGWKPRSPGVRPWRDFPHHALVLTVSGTARYADARGREAILHPGDALAVFPGLAHWFLPERDAGWDEYFIIFSGATFAPWMAGPAFSPERPVVALGGVDYWLRRFAAVVGERRSPRPLESIARLHGLLADLAQAATAGTRPEQQAWLDRARALLGDVEKRASLGAIARRLGCSDQVFRKRFRDLANEPPGTYRERARLERACLSLATSSVGEVAHELGFCDQFQFSRRFKARYGISPMQFQRL